MPRQRYRRLQSAAAIHSFHRQTASRCTGQAVDHIEPTSPFSRNAGIRLCGIGQCVAAACRHHGYPFFLFYIPIFANSFSVTKVYYLCLALNSNYRCKAPAVCVFWCADGACAQVYRYAKGAISLLKFIICICDYCAKNGQRSVKV